MPCETSASTICVLVRKEWEKNSLQSARLIIRWESLPQLLSKKKHIDMIKSNFQLDNDLKDW